MKNAMKVINILGSLCNLINVGMGLYFGVNRTLEIIEAEKKRKPIGFIWDYEEDAR